MPKSLAAKPDLYPHLQRVWDAFWALHGDRQIGFGIVGPLSFSAIDRYASRFGVEGDSFEHFTTLLTAMDGEWRKVVNKPGK